MVNTTAETGIGRTAGADGERKKSQMEILDRQMTVKKLSAKQLASMLVVEDFERDMLAVEIADARLGENETAITMSVWERIEQALNGDSPSLHPPRETSLRQVTAPTVPIPETAETTVEQTSGEKRQIQVPAPPAVDGNENGKEPEHRAAVVHEQSREERSADAERIEANIKFTSQQFSRYFKNQMIQIVCNERTGERVLRIADRSISSDEFLQIVLAKTQE